jgi:thioredoxin 1
VLYSQPGALPESALQQLIAKAKELDMDEVRASITAAEDTTPEDPAPQAPESTAPQAPEDSAPQAPENTVPAKA